MRFILSANAHPLVLCCIPWGWCEAWGAARVFSSVFASAPSAGPAYPHYRRLLSPRACPSSRAQRSSLSFGAKLWGETGVVSHLSYSILSLSRTLYTCAYGVASPSAALPTSLCTCRVRADVLLLPTGAQRENGINCTMK